MVVMLAQNKYVLKLSNAMIEARIEGTVDSKEQFHCSFKFPSAFHLCIALHHTIYSLGCSMTIVLLLRITLGLGLLSSLLVLYHRPTIIIISALS